jgi:flotillin
MLENLSIPGFIPGTLTAVAVAVTAVVMAKNLRQVVKPNMVHIVRKRKSTVIYGGGSKASEIAEEQEEGYTAEGNAYWEWPEWIPVIGLTKVALPLSIFDLDLYKYEAYDEDKVPFMVDVKAFFVIDKPSIAAERLANMAELMNHLQGILQGTVRMVLAKYNVEKIMVDRSVFGELFTKATEEQLREWGVRNAKPIELMDIRDGHNSDIITRIQAKQESKITMESDMEVAKNEKDGRIAVIDAQREGDVRQEQADQLVGERRAVKTQAVGVANEQAKQSIQEQAEITTERDMAVHRVTVVRNAEITKDARIVKAEEDRKTKVINADAVRQEKIVYAEGIKKDKIIQAEGQKQQTITVAEGVKAQTVTIAEGDLVNEQLNGQGILAVGEAVAEAARLLEMARVNPELALAEFIGENPEYLAYLVNLANIEKGTVVGTAQAKALEKADVKVITNTGDTINGVDSAMDLFSSKGGTAVGSMIEAVAQTPAGAEMLSNLGVGNGASG